MLNWKHIGQHSILSNPKSLGCSDRSFSSSDCDKGRTLLSWRSMRLLLTRRSRGGVMRHVNTFVSGLEKVLSGDPK